MVLGGLGACWVVLIDCRVYFTFELAIWMVAGESGGHWVIKLNSMVYLASV